MFHSNHAGPTDGTFDAASELNKVLQTGRCSAQFKSVQSYEDSCSMVNLAGVGNAHPSAFFDVVSGAAGSHHVATAERFLLVTGRAVDPHTPLDIDLPVTYRRWVWCPLVEAMLEPLGLPAEAMQEEYARQTYEEAVAEEGDAEEGTFVPSKSGYVVAFADGVESRLRFKVVRDSGHTWKIPQLRFPNRDIPLEPRQSVELMTRRVLDCFEESHKVVELSREAKELFTGYEASFNVQAALTREGAEADGRLGTAAWHLVMLAASNYIFEIACGDISVAPTDPLVIQPKHVNRAAAELRLIHAVVALWKSKKPQGTTLARPDYGPMAASLSRAQRLQAACEAAPLPSQVPAFVPSQPSGSPEKCEAEEPVEMLPSQVKPLKLEDPEVPALTTGYGENGESVQDPSLGTVVHGDRVSWLRGGMEVTGSTAMLKTMSLGYFQV